MAGIDVVRGRIIAWLLTALIAGLAGGVFAWYISVFYPETAFDLAVSIFAIVFALFGGTTTLTGPLLGVVILYGIYNCDRHLRAAVFPAHLRPLIMGLVLFLPNGLVSLLTPPGHPCPLTLRRLLRVEKLVKRFGGFRALDGREFPLSAGEVLGLVGPNGSGKTTCINVISGLYPPDGGRVLFEGRSIGGAAVAPAGPARHQSHLPVAEAVPVADRARERRNRRTPTATPGEPPDLDALLASLDLDRLAERPAGELNSAQQKTLDLGRALATPPRLLLVDELAAASIPAELSRMADRLRELAASGMALLVVEHLMGFIDQVTDRVIVMNAGKEILRGHAGGGDHGPGGDPRLPRRRRQA